jgi:SH3-like domain-containing protein
VRLLIASLLLVVPTFAGALEYRSTGRAAVLYDAPSATAGKVAVAGAGLPLEVVIVTDAWVKVRDHSGRLAWIESAALGGSRHAMVRSETAAVRQQPRPDAEVVFQAARGVLLEVTGAVDAYGWMPVKHADGLAGWLPAHEAWGR